MKANGDYTVTSRFTGSDNGGRWRWVGKYDLEGYLPGGSAWCGWGLDYVYYQTHWNYNSQVVRRVENLSAYGGSRFVLPGDYYKLTTTGYAVDRAGKWSKPVKVTRHVRGPRPQRR